MVHHIPLRLRKLRSGALHFKPGLPQSLLCIVQPSLSALHGALLMAGNRADDFVAELSRDSFSAASVWHPLKLLRQ